MADERLSSAEHQEFVERIAELARSGMPLPEGLRAAARESSSRRLAGQLTRLAHRFEAGANWEAVLEPGATSIAPHVLGVIRAGIRSGNLSEALDSLIDQDRAYRDTWRQLYSTLAYPAVLCIFTFGLMLATLLLIVPQMKQIFSEFGTELPAATLVWIRLGDTLPVVMLVGSIALAVFLAAIRIFGGASGWMRFMASIPIVGPMVHFAGISQMLRLLEIMLSHGIPLPDALQLASAGASDANVKVLATWLATGTEKGMSLAALMESTPRLPALIVPVVRWGEANGAIGSAMRSAYELLEGRIGLRSSLLSILVGPLLLIFLGLALGSLIVAMFMPLISLIQNLT